MGFSINTFPYTGGSQTFNLSFALGYIEESDVAVQVVGEVDGTGQPIDRTFVFNSENEIEVVDALPNPCEVRVVRTVNKENPPVDFSQPGSATREAIELNSIHNLMAVHEALDGRIAGSEFTADEALSEVRDSIATSRAWAESETAPGDVGTKSSKTWAEESETSATAAADSETAAGSSASTASSAASTASSAASTATGAAAAASASAASALLSEDAAELAEAGAEASELAAAMSETAAATSESNAATSASEASTSASSASTSASNAATSASEADTSASDAETAAASITGIINTSSSDTTSGNLMRNGDHGWGGTGDAPLLSDMNATDKARGSYRTDNTTTGTFPTAEKDGSLLIFGHDADHSLEIFMPETSGSPVYTRQKSAGVFEGWEPLMSSAQADTNVLTDDGLAALTRAAARHILNTYSELSTYTAASVGQYVYVQDIGATFERVSSGGDLDLSHSWDVLPGKLGYDPRAFGATGDGVADDRTYLQDAITKGDLDLTGGSYRTTASITVPAETRTVTGNGRGDIVFDPASFSTCFNITRTDGINGHLIFNGVRATTSVADAGIFVRGTETRATSGPFVVGGYDFITLNDCRIVSAGSGYWRVGAQLINAGGLRVRGTTVANYGNTTAQAADTTAYSISNDDGDFNIIRAFDGDQMYTQRFRHGITVYSDNSVESVYVGAGELVGHTYGIRFRTGGTGKVGAVHVVGTHMDCTEANIQSDSGVTVNVMRLNDADLRLGENGATAVNTGRNVYMQGPGNYWVIGGCFFDAVESTTAQRGIETVLTVPLVLVDDNVFRHHERAIRMPSQSHSAKIGRNVFEDVGIEYDIAINPLIEIEESSRVNMRATAFSGDLDTLAGSRRGMTTAAIASGFSNGPAGVTGSGHAITTWVYDGNAAHQELRTATSPYMYLRRKFGGVWTAWVAVTVT